MATGTLKWFNREKGYGYIMPDNGERDIYVQLSNIETPDNYLVDGQRVEYELAMGRKGPEAIKVKPI
jgi:CspA family cold shock protein